MRHLDNAKIPNDTSLDHLPADIARDRGSVQTHLAGHYSPAEYLDPVSGGATCKTYHMIFDTINAARGSKLTGHKIADRFLDLMISICPYKVGNKKFDFEKHFYDLLEIYNVNGTSL